PVEGAGRPRSARRRWSGAPRRGGHEDGAHGDRPHLRHGEGDPVSAREGREPGRHPGLARAIGRPYGGGAAMTAERTKPQPTGSQHTETQHTTPPASAVLARSPASSALTKSWVHHGKARPDNLADRVYQAIKEDIFEFRLQPGTRFTETEVARRTAASRTPVRPALYRLQREGYLEVYFRNGWRVRPFDFDYFEELYDVRIVLELAAVERLCAWPEGQTCPELETLEATWMTGERQFDGPRAAALDE